MDLISQERKDAIFVDNNFRGFCKYFQLFNILFLKNESYFAKLSPYDSNELGINRASQFPCGVHRDLQICSDYD